MALSTTTTSKLDILQLGETLQAPLPTPRNAPAYVPPTDPLISLAPLTARPPLDQYMGKGGTSFGSVPPIYILPPVIRYDTPEAGYDELAYRPEKFVLQGPIEPQAKGAIMPVPVGQQPTKGPVPAGVTSVETPGPITGTVAGYDLARVPLWAWLVAAALIGSKVLR